jgi:hypothetical protein
VLLKDVIAKSLTERDLRDSTGMDAKITKLEIGLATPTANLEGLTLYNPPEFGGGTFLEMPELRVEWLPGELKAGKVHFKTLRLNLSEVHIVRNKAGKTNIEAVHKSVSNKKSGKGGFDVPGVDFAGVDTIYLKVGRIKYTDESNSKNNVEFNLGSREDVGRNLKTEKEIEQWFQLSLFKMALTQAATSPASDRERAQKLLFDSLFRILNPKR